MKLSFSLAFAICVLGALTVNAQDHVLTITDGSAGVGSLADLTNVYDNNSGVNIQGYGWGNCIADPAIAEITAVAEGGNSGGSAGGSAAFFAPAIFPGEGWTLGGVTDFLGMVTLDAGSTGNALAIASYEVLAVGSTAVDYCDTLGSPLVATSVADTAATNFIPVQSGGTITGEDAGAPFIFIAADDTVEYDGLTGLGSFTGSFSISENPEALGAGDTTGFSMGCMHDSALLTISALSTAPLEATLGAAPAFAGPAILADGWTIGVVYDFLSMLPLAFDPAVDVIDVDYDVTAPLAPAPNTVTNLTFVDTLGDPAVVNTVTIGVAASAVLFDDGEITLVPLTDLEFVRSDCNDDGNSNIADGIYILNALFQGGPQGPCAEACDANADDLFDTSDAIFIFNYRFLDGPDPSAPFPDCGIEMGADCEAYSGCP